ncbi:MAG TPA: gamma-glutamyl-gamma-aminobutyrate hydrolase family protein, partial [Bryobacteraceae bacterium]|nr:gamma-glutamyl-gamma-aminobutyrate hydrolase family protein [Bryobacteraceae bacterium]
LDALLITGGGDVNPALYGRASEPQTQPPDDPRDHLEIRLLQQALDRDLPVLAICRGMQLLNVAHGGTLVQHLEGHSVRSADPSIPVHDVHVAEGTRLARILGAGAHPVNSRHHQAVEEVGQGLAIIARSPEGVIEGLERTDRRFVVAVQWHPEDQARTDAVQLRLFEAFAESLRQGLTVAGDGSVHSG